MLNVMSTDASSDRVEQCLEWLGSNERPYDHIYDIILIEGSIRQVATWLLAKSRGRYACDEFIKAILAIAYWEVIDWIRQDVQEPNAHAIACTRDFIERIREVAPDLAHELKARHEDAVQRLPQQH